MAALILLWWLGALAAGTDLLPSPFRVLALIGHEAVNGELFYHIGVTLWRVLASFTISMAVGVTLGLLMGLSARTNMALDSWLLFFLNMPALVVMILAYIWLGLTEVAAIAAVAINKIPNVVVMVREGARAMDQELQQMARIFQFSRWNRIRHIMLPELTPYITATARSGIALIWKIVLVVELLGRSNGIGFQLHQQFQLFDVAGIMAWGLTFIIIMQVVEIFFLQPLETHVNRWRRK